MFQKDVGGPGVVGGTLIGVISFGAPVCGAIDSPTVFTKLGYYGKWIDSVIRTVIFQFSVSSSYIGSLSTLMFMAEKKYLNLAHTHTQLGWWLGHWLFPPIYQR